MVRRHASKRHRTHPNADVQAFRQLRVPRPTQSRPSTGKGVLGFRNRTRPRPPAFAKPTARQAVLCGGRGSRKTSTAEQGHQHVDAILFARPTGAPSRAQDAPLPSTTPIRPYAETPTRNFPRPFAVSPSRPFAVSPIPSRQPSLSRYLPQPRACCAVAKRRRKRKGG